MCECVYVCMYACMIFTTCAKMGLQKLRNKKENIFLIQITETFGYDLVFKRFEGKHVSSDGREERKEE